MADGAAAAVAAAAAAAGGGGKERTGRNADGRSMAESNLTLQELMTVGDPNVLSADAQHSALSDLARIANQLDSSGRKAGGVMGSAAAAADALHASVVLGRHKAASLSADHLAHPRPSVIQKKSHSRYLICIWIIPNSIRLNRTRLNSSQFN